MDINILKTFIEVYRTRHFGKAADNLFVTQSTVSARVRQLEEALGVQLFYRDRNNIQLTPPGQRFLKHAESILNTWNRARFDIDLSEDTKTRLIIGGEPSLWDLYLGEWLLKIRKNLPHIVLAAEAVSTESMVRQLVDRTIDLGFTCEFPQIRNITISESFAFELVMISTKQGLGPDQAIQSGYVYVDWGTSFANQHAKFFAEAPAPDIRTGLGHLALGFIKKNGGSAYLPEPMIRDDLLKDQLYLVNDAPVIHHKSFVLFHEDSDRRDLIEEVISWNTRNESK